jgi:hypothetical protein
MVYNWATLFLGKYVQESVPHSCGGGAKVSKWRNKNMVISLAGLRPEKVCAGEAQQQRQIADLSSHQRGRPIITIPQLSKYNFHGCERKIVACHRWWTETRTDWSTDHRS